METESVFVAEHESYRPAEWAVGPWAPDLLQGSASAGLLARTLERADRPQPMVVARLAFDFWRPVTRGPVATSLSVLRASDVSSVRRRRHARSGRLAGIRRVG